MQLQYDSVPVQIGSLESSVWVFGLLGSFYAVLGSLYVLSDSLIASGALGEGEHCLNGHRCCPCTVEYGTLLIRCRDRMSSLCCCLHIRPRFAHRHQLNGRNFSADNSNQKADGHSPWRFKHRFLLCPGQNVAATAKAADRADLPFTVLSLGIVAALHELSAILYAQGGHLLCRRQEILHLANVSLQGISGESSLIAMTPQAPLQPGDGST